VVAGGSRRRRANSAVGLPSWRSRPSRITMLILGLLFAAELWWLAEARAKTRAA
jgi:hypothetical protein